MSEEEIVNKTYDVFISYYSKTGQDFARYLKNGLSEFSVNVFLDEKDVPKSIKEETDEWRNYIDHAIKVSRNFILLMTIGFNKRKEILRELKLALENNQKKYFFKHESLGKQDLAVEIGDKLIDLSKYEYLPFSNEVELLRKVVALLLGKIGRKEPLFMNEARSIIASEGSRFRKAGVPIVEMVIGPANKVEEWLLPTPQNRYLLSCFPYCIEIEARRKFFECTPTEDIFYKVRTNGFFHTSLSLVSDSEDSNLFYFDNIFRDIAQTLLFSIRIMKFYNVQSEQAMLIFLRNIGDKKVTFNTWGGRIWKYSFTNSLPEIEFFFNFCPKDEWKQIGEVLLKIYRELCTEAGCLDITDSTIKKRVYGVLRGMQELRTQYNGDKVTLPRVDITAFALG